MSRTTGYLIPFSDRAVAVCKACIDDLGWFPMELYRGTIEVVHDLIDGLKRIDEYECAQCRKFFRGGQK